MGYEATPADTLKVALWRTKQRLDAGKGQNRPTVGIAFGSGAARGLAHIGVLKALQYAQIPIDIVVGCSMGAVVGGCYAAGMDPSEIEREGARIDKRVVVRYTDLVIPTRGGIVGGSKIEDLLKSLTGEKTFDDLRIPFVCTAADILTGAEVAIDDGPVYQAIRASMSMPGVFRPVVCGDHVLVDGGILNPIPVNYLTALGVDVTIAVDVMPVLEPTPEQLGRVPSVVHTLVNAFDIMGKIIAAPSPGRATVSIRPDVGDVPLVEFWRGEELIEKGRVAAELALPEIRKAVLGR